MIQLISALMAEFEDDHVGLWAVVKQVRRAFPDDRPAAVRSKALSLVRFFLDMGCIKAGFPAEDGRGFQTWTIGPADVISAIESEWRDSGPDPGVGEIVWFTTPDVPSSDPTPVSSPVRRRA